MGLKLSRPGEYYRSLQLVKLDWGFDSSHSKTALRCRIRLTSAAAAPSAFTVFPLLPIELRLQIWSLAIAPRLLSARRERLLGHVPAVLQTCRESRAGCMHQFQQLYWNLMPGPFVYFHPELDTLLYPAYLWMYPKFHVIYERTLNFDPVSRFAHLAIEETFWRALSSTLLTEICASKILKSLTVITNRVKVSELAGQNTKLIYGPATSLRSSNTAAWTAITQIESLELRTARLEEY